MQTVPWILGIAHPTGFPVYTLLGWLFTHALLFGSVAWRTNILSGLCAAVSSAAVADIILLLDADGFTALLGSLLFSWSNLIWTRAIHADPHTMSAMFVILTLLFALRYGRYGKARDIYCSALLAGLGLATHPEALFVLPAIATAILSRRTLDWKRYLGTAALILLPLVFYAYLPLRSAFVVAHGIDPLSLPPFDGSQASLYDSDHTSTLTGFIHEVSGDQFGAAGAFARVLDVRTYPDAVTYWWQKMLPYTNVFELALAAFGLIALVQRDARSFLILAIGTLGILPFVFAYHNIEADVDRYFITSVALIAVLAALSSSLLLRKPLQPVVVTLAYVLLAVSAGLQWRLNASGTIAYRTDQGGQIAIDAAKAGIPDGAIIVSSWLDATSLEYGSFVQHSLGSRVVVVGWPGAFQNDYARWVKVRPVYIFANPDSYANAKTLPCGWVKEDVPSDGYRHILHVIPRTSPPLRETSSAKQTDCTITS